MTRHTLTHWLPSRRTMLKGLHLTLVPLLIWFVFVTPEGILRFGGQAAFRVHSVLGLVFVALTLWWTLDFWRRGLASRPGPKLKGWARRLHPILHKTLIWGMFGVALTGFLLGLTSTVLLWAGGVVPIAPPLGLPQANHWVGQFHIVEFYVIAGVVLFHAAFHIWRHVKLKDNALRIMAPKLLHRFL